MARLTLVDDTECMGNTHTPKYRIEYRGVVVLTGTEARRVSLTPHGWDCKNAGRPSDENLRRYIEGFEASTLPGGTNEHLGITRVSSAKIVFNTGYGETVATYEPSPFEAR